MNKKRVHIVFFFLGLLCFLSKTSAFAQEVLIDTAEQETTVNRFDSGWQWEMKPVEPLQLADSEIKKLKTQDDYWYANYRPGKKKVAASGNEGTGLFQKSWFRNLLWFLIIIAFLAALVWYLLSSDIQIFRKEAKPVASEAEETESNIFEIDYDAGISKAIEEGNYRMATRLYYLRTLRELSDKGLILYHHEMTNSEYLKQLAGTNYYREFFRLTRDFEYTWYGQFELSPASFALIEKDFKQFKQGLP